MVIAGIDFNKPDWNVVQEKGRLGHSGLVFKLADCKKADDNCEGS